MVFWWDCRVCGKKNQPHYTVRVVGLDPYPTWMVKSWLNSAGNVVYGMIEGNDSASIRVTAARLLWIKWQLMGFRIFYSNQTLVKSGVPSNRQCSLQQKIIKNPSWRVLRGFPFLGADSTASRLLGGFQGPLMDFGSSFSSCVDYPVFTVGFSPL